MKRSVSICGGIVTVWQTFRIGQEEIAARVHARTTHDITGGHDARMIQSGGGCRRNSVAGAVAARRGIVLSITLPPLLSALSVIQIRGHAAQQQWRMVAERWILLNPHIDVDQRAIAEASRGCSAGY